MTLSLALFVCQTGKAFLVMFGVTILNHFIETMIPTR